MSKQKDNATPSAEAAPERRVLLEQTARVLVETLGDETAAAIAGKCIVTYGNHPADLESARLAQAIVRTMGVERFNNAQVL
jgi:hypothetical protein